MPNRTMSFSAQCPFCQSFNEVMVDPDDMITYVTGEELIQNVFTYLTPDERELLITGICPACFPS